ncbi:hypothetical protein EVJ58_g2500 [Rhodofomes roseus]|uniref:Uncharacterized protein n=1 Tax=Rhodofomes roseus TaxID=34475 RepID=A0A4Y9YSV7_9APHY|nr:hypothetical protein EVJ58_g2500 [Rhodofomes roseus]
MQDPSDRIYAGKLRQFPAFSDLGFDHLAQTISPQQGFSLSQVITDEYMSHLGRPLFGSLWNSKDIGIQARIIEIARDKLIGSRTSESEESTTNTIMNWQENQLFACLSQRLQLEFNCTTYTAQQYARQQVEGHMRICIKMDESYESMFSISGSEPLLAEAAYSAMSDPSFNAPEALKLVLNKFSVHKGDRGELLTLLLLTLARDATVGKADESGRPDSGVRGRMFKISDFFGNLLQGFQPNPGHEDSRVSESEHLSVDKVSTIDDFIRDFRECYLHFNHFVKLHQQSVPNPKNLLALLARGAAVLCANNQPGVDAILTGIHGDYAHPSKLCVILVQSKNDSKYTAVPQEEIFNAMDPYVSEMLVPPDETLDTKPIIRIVFALAVERKNARLTVKKRTNRSKVKGQLIKWDSYDLWIGGLASAVFGPISPEAEDVWKALLQASYGWDDPYKFLDHATKALRRSMNAGAGTHEDFWNAWVNNNIRKKPT